VTAYDGQGSVKVLTHGSELREWRELLPTLSGNSCNSMQEIMANADFDMALTTEL
jgi:hypothetical protein